MPRRPPGKVPRGIPRRRKAKASKAMRRAYLTPAVLHPFKRPQRAS